MTKYYDSSFNANKIYAKLARFNVIISQSTFCFADIPVNYKYSFAFIISFFTISVYEMANKNSASSQSEKNKEIWRKNLVNFDDSVKRRGPISIESVPLSDKNRMPLQRNIVGRYLYLADSIKSRNDRSKVICEELINLWRKLNFSHVSPQNVKQKIDKVLKTYDECLKRGNLDKLNELMDITKIDGSWLCSEDKNLYLLQVESKGQVGYTTEKLDSKKKIHPSKRERQNSMDKERWNTADVEMEESDTEVSEFSDIEGVSGTSRSRSYNSTKVGSKLMVTCGLSSKKSAKVCKNISDEGISIPTPTQSGIYKATIKEAKQFKEELKARLKHNHYSLHFDGKIIDKKEFQVVLLKNETEEIKLDILCLEDGKSQIIFDALHEVIKEFDLFKSIKMIVTDVTNTNAGKNNGVVVRLQRLFASKGLQEPQFIGCQHHILDRILRVVMDSEFEGRTSSPNIAYNFVTELIEKYEELKVSFLNGEDELLWTPEGLRDDMKFLFHLTQVFNFYLEFNRFPKVHFKKIPNLSNARWNSRAIVALLAYILMPNERNTLYKVCYFISKQWAKFWFSDQMYKESDFDGLVSILADYDKKASNTLNNFWSKFPSAIPIPRSNQCAERAVKIMQDLYPYCKSHETLRLRFVLSNKS